MAPPAAVPGRPYIIANGPLELSTVSPESVYRLEKSRQGKRGQNYLSGPLFLRGGRGSHVPWRAAAMNLPAP